MNLTATECRAREAEWKARLLAAFEGLNIVLFEPIVDAALKLNDVSTSEPKPDTTENK